MLNDMITLVLAYHTIPKFIVKLIDWLKETNNKFQKSNLGEFAKILKNTGETELISLSNVKILILGEIDKIILNQVEEYWGCLLGNENIQKIEIDQ